MLASSRMLLALLEGLRAPRSEKYLLIMEVASLRVSMLERRCSFVSVDTFSSLLESEKSSLIL